MSPLSTRCRAWPCRVPSYLEQKGPWRLELHTTSKPLSAGGGLSADHRDWFRLEPMDTPNSFMHT